MVRSRTVVAWIAVMVVLTLGVIGLLVALDTPEVYFDSNGKCVRVVPTWRGSCEDLPDGEYTAVTK